MPMLIPGLPRNPVSAGPAETRIQPDFYVVAPKISSPRIRFSRIFNPLNPITTVFPLNLHCASFATRKGPFTICPSLKSQKFVHLVQPLCHKLATRCILSMLLINLVLLPAQSPSLMIFFRSSNPFNMYKSQTPQHFPLSGSLVIV